jgi:hypothetical protein
MLAVPGVCYALLSACFRILQFQEQVDVYISLSTPKNVQYFLLWIVNARYILENRRVKFFYDRGRHSYKLMTLRGKTNTGPTCRHFAQTCRRGQ